MVAQNLITRASMLEAWQKGQGQLSVERLGQNYGRAALNLLVQLALTNVYDIPGKEIFRLVSHSRPSADMFQPTKCFSIIKMS